MASIVHHGGNSAHAKKYEIDMVHGPLLGKILIFSLPLMASGVLQLLFNAADIIVVGRFTGPESIAAVGSTTSLVNLMISLFMGISVGVNVQVSHFFGAGDEDGCRETVQTSVCMGLIGGIILAIVGFFLSRPILQLMGSPDDVIDLAALYLKIYFLGMPVIMLYNFGSAILRGVGDTRRPLYFLMLAGVVNVLLNLFFVIVLKLGVAGVALATILSQVISAILVVGTLVNYDGAIRFDPAPSKLRINPVRAAAILRIGLPAGLQTALFSISNVIIQASVNSFGSMVMAGNAAAQNLEGFVYISMNALMQASVTFTSANYGAGERERVKKVLFLCLAVVTTVGLVLGQAVYRFGTPLLSIYTDDAQTIRFGLDRLSVTCAHYFLCGLMDTSTGALRGIGYSVMSMIICLIGSCALRILWVMTVFAANPTTFLLYISYPISWLLTFLVQFVCFFAFRDKAFRKLGK